MVEAHDPWVLLGAIAQATERMRLGTMVTPLSRRRPRVVAKHLTTLDHLSGGRAVLGVGLGDPPDLDFSDFGDEPSYRVRAAITDEALTVIAALLGEGRVAHHGEPPRRQASVRPLPVQRPRIPIWVAGRAPHTLPLRGRSAGTATSRSPTTFLAPEALAAYVGPPPHDGWDLVAQWTTGIHAGGVRGGRRDLADALGLAEGGRVARRAPRAGHRRAGVTAVPPLGVEPRLNRF